MTPNSSTTPYLLPIDLENRYDPRLMAQLCSIDPSNPVVYNPPTEDTLSTNPVFLTAINAAGGEFESACLRAGAYQVSDLQSLQGQSLEYMKGIIAAIAIMKIYKFRAGPNPAESIVEDYNQAMQSLNDLAQGNKILAFSQTEQAGLPSVYRMQSQDYIQNNYVTAPSRYGRFMGIRQEYRRFF